MRVVSCQCQLLVETQVSECADWLEERHSDSDAHLKTSIIPRTVVPPTEN
jgi:hypothetical protein